MRATTSGGVGVTVGVGSGDLVTVGVVETAALLLASVVVCRAVGCRGLCGLPGSFQGGKRV